MKYRYLLKSIDRHGNVRWYLRRGGKKIRLRAEPGSAEFSIEYGNALRGIEPPKPPPPLRPLQAKPDTLRWLCDQYVGTAGEFARLTDRTKATRRGLFKLICAEEVKPGGPTLGDTPYRSFQASHIRKLRDRHAQTPEGANNRVKALRQVFSWAMTADLCAENPARLVPYFESDGEGFHTWTIDEVEQFKARHPAGSKARRALMLFQFTGGRRSDVAKMGKQMIRDGWLKWTETKGRKRKIKITEIPILPILQEELDLAPAGELTFLMTEYGKPFTAAGLGNWFRDRCDEAGLPQCSAHGLRKAGATTAAENGATEYELMAIFGWTTAKQAATYTRKANRRRLAGQAMGLLVGTPGKQN